MDKITLLALARQHRGARFSPFEKRFLGVNLKPAFFLAMGMALDATGFEQRFDVLSKIDFLLSGRWQRAGRGRSLDQRGRYLGQEENSCYKKTDVSSPGFNQGMKRRSFFGAGPVG